MLLCSSTKKGPGLGPSLVFPPKHKFIMPYPQEFVDTVRVRIKSEWYDPDYLQDLNNFPRQCLKAIKEENDYEIAVKYRKGVMFDLLKQIYGCSHPDKTDVQIDSQTGETTTTTIRKGKTYSPKPQYYHFFAYTAYALLHGDIRELNWRAPYNSNIQGQDVLYAINKYGIYGLTEEISSTFSKKFFVSKFAALYARMFNADPRFQTHTAEPLELKTETRESPLTYCGDCKTIRVAWDINKTAYRPGHPKYNELLGKFKEQIIKKEFEKSTAEDQTRYLERRGTLLNFEDGDTA